MDWNAVEYPPTQYRMSLAASPHAVRHVRRIVRAYLRLWGLAVLSDAAELAVSELLANVINHVPGSQCTALLRRLPAGVRVEIGDSSTALPAPRAAHPWDENGRGLALVGEITDAWGVELTPATGGKTVWFEIAVSTSGAESVSSTERGRKALDATP